MALVTEILLVSGVALDLVGAGILSHAHNAESIVELREDIGEEGSAVGEPDAISTHAQLLAEKRIGFLLLTLGLVLYRRGGAGQPGPGPGLHPGGRQPDPAPGPGGPGTARSGRAARAVRRCGPDAGVRPGRSTVPLTRG